MREVCSLVNRGQKLQARIPPTTTISPPVTPDQPPSVPTVSVTKDRTTASPTSATVMGKIPLISRTKLPSYPKDKMNRSFSSSWYND